MLKLTFVSEALQAQEPPDTEDLIAIKKINDGDKISQVRGA